MIFVWNIDAWAANELHPELRDPNEQNLNWLLVLLTPVSYLYNIFYAFYLATILKMRINGQIIVLENYLNDLFDADLRRIIIISTWDLLPRTFIYQAGENHPLYIYQFGEDNPVYIYNSAEFGNVYDFIVQAAVGSLTAAQIIQIKAVVNYYRIAGKKPYFQYDDLTPF